MERALIPFTIPLAGSKKGVTIFEMSCDASFFACFQESPVESGALNVQVTLDKRADMSLLHFELAGRLATTCDRCLAPIGMPVSGRYDLVLKPGETYEEDDEVVTIPPDMSEINVAGFVYEFAILALPVRRVYDCQQDTPAPCNQEVLAYLGPSEREPEPPAEEKNENPFRDLLEKLNKN